MASCRTCLGPVDLPVNLFGSNYTNLLEILERLLDFQVYEDGLTFIICRHCQAKLICVSEFRMVCLKSVAPLRHDAALISRDDLSDGPQLLKLDVVLTRCPKIENLLATFEKTFGGEEVDSSLPNEDDYSKNLKGLPNTKTRNYVRKNVEYLNRSRYKQFPISEVLQALKEIRKCRSHLQEKQCMFCDFIGRNAITLRRHLNTTHKDINNWCEYCNIETEDLQNHRDTVQCHRWQCKFCQRYFAELKHMTRHLRCHSRNGIGTVPLKFQQFSKDAVLKAIEDTRLGKDGSVRRCKLCNYVGKEVGHLRIHMHGKHNMECHKWCRYCNIVTEDIDGHRKEVQCYGDKCQFCNETFTNVKYLRRHLQQHCRDDLFRKRTQLLNESKTIQTSSVDKESFRTNLNCDSNLMDICAATVDDTKITVDVNLHNQDEDSSFGSDNVASDSDYQTEIVKKRRRRIIRLAIEQEDKPFARKSIYKQYEFREVLEAIEELNSRSTDLKYRQCTLCDFIGEKAIVLQAHVRKKHKNLKNWCGLCNMQTEDLQQHRDSVQCHRSQCKFCKKNCPKRKHLKNHLISHCHSFKTALTKAIVRSRIVSHRQYPDDQVRKALADCKSNIVNRKCIYCDHTSSKSFGISGLALHMRSMHASQMNTWCKRCNLQTEDLPHHLNTVKCLEKRCRFCKKIFTNISKLTAHLRLHCLTKNETPSMNSTSPKDKPDYDEPKSSSNVAVLQNDSSTSSGKCTTCRIFFRNLEKHMTRQHKSSKNKTLCAYCGKTFPSFTTLKTHSDRVHDDKKSFKCEFECSLCIGSFPTERSLKLHERCHKKTDPIICDICGKSSLSKLRHIKHLEGHKYGTGPLQCQHCDKKYYGRRSFKLHLRQHAGTNKYHCIPCGKSFAYKCLLQCHLKMHNDIQPFECSVCGKRFKAAETRKRHERIHTGDKRYKCSFCPFRSVQAKGLTMHMKQHPEDAPQASKPHKCQRCHRSFSTNALLVSHVEYCHRDCLKK